MRLQNNLLKIWIVAAIFAGHTASALEFSMDDMMGHFFRKELGCPPIITTGSDQREAQRQVYNSSDDLCKKASSAWNMVRSSETVEEKVEWIGKSMRAYQEQGDHQNALSAVLALINTDSDLEFADETRIWPLRIASAADIVAGTEYDNTMNMWLLASPMTPTEAGRISIASFLYDFPDSKLRGEAEALEKQAFKLYFDREFAISKTIETNLNANLFDLGRAKKKQVLTRYVRLQPVVNVVCKYFADRTLGPDAMGNCKIDELAAQDYLKFLKSLYRSEASFQTLIADYIAVAGELAKVVTAKDSVKDLPDMLFQNSFFGLKQNSKVNRKSVANKLKKEATAIAQALK